MMIRCAVYDQGFHSCKKYSEIRLLANMPKSDYRKKNELEIHKTGRKKSNSSLFLPHPNIFFMMFWKS